MSKRRIKPRLDPARAIIDVFKDEGKVDANGKKEDAIAVVARITGVSTVSVWRWMQPKSDGGTDGHIPHPNPEPLLAYAREHGLPLSEPDFFVQRVPGVPKVECQSVA